MGRGHGMRSRHAGWWRRGLLWLVFGTGRQNTGTADYRGQEK